MSDLNENHYFVVSFLSLGLAETRLVLEPPFAPPRTVEKGESRRSIARKRENLSASLRPPVVSGERGSAPERERARLPARRPARTLVNKLTR